MDDHGRFDDIVRSERYFTATLLPLILFEGFGKDYRGINAFLRLLSPKQARGRTGEIMNEFDWLPSVGDRNEEPQVITEFHIKRDLHFSRPGLFDAPESEQSRDAAPGEETAKERRDAPDLVLILGQTFVVCEGKFFDNGSSSLTRLNDQLRSQRSQVKYLFDADSRLNAYVHVALVPAKHDGEYDCDAVITWEQIADLAEQVLGPDSYAARRLRAASRVYEENRGDRTTKNYDGILSLEGIVAKCKEVGESIWVGHVGGPSDLKTREIAYAKTKKWKWRNPKTNNGNADRKNWIDGSQFLTLIESMRKV
ncbi:MAG: hypothetical protein WD208_04645 [Dehalococcoidia bacterium]